MKVRIYMASSIKGLHKKTGVVAYVLEAEEKTVTQFGKVENANENESLIKDLKHALERVNRKSEIALYIDNYHIERAFALDWLEGWKTAEWKNAKGKDVANKEDWQRIADLLNGRTVEVHFKEEHSYRKWLEAEVERRSKKYV